MNVWDEGVRGFSRRTVEPADLPLSVDYVKREVLRVATDGPDEDGFIESCIRAATDACEKDTGRALVPQTWAVTLDRFPCGSEEIVLPRLPLIAVESIAYVDADGNDAELSASSPTEFITIPSGEFVRGRIAPLFGETWPTARLQPAAVTITFTCGYEDEIPASLRVGMGLMIAELFKQRSLSTDESTPARLNLSRFWRKVEG